ncbi:hypothetical protein PVAND_010840 [Polypedilum vanderplanki]|uniref:Epidermal growth factor receptor substrate 15-like 1 n=1 Tax=Polypedilum vanderplanki TaxID=319348 RepID=A0A9J6CGT5_POLVA|nr:hypothetical protein PVAND_010840 [Polypedilum vanderplanki]
MDAARFLKKSGLSDVVLSRVWDLSDPGGKGFLDKTGFFVSLKLVSLAQAGENINVKNLLMETNAPRCGDVPKMKPPPVPKMTHPGVPPHPPSVLAAASNTDWTIKPEEKAKYQALFNQLQPVNGVLAGNKVVNVLKNSKLPTETLSAIWELADQDKDGSLDEHEFVVAMHLVYKALDSRAIPSSLPKELVKPAKSDDFGNGGFVANFPTDIVPVAPVVPPPARPVPPASATNIPAVPLIPAIPSVVSKDGWVLTTIERLKYQEIFEKSDLDKDGLVSGMEIKDIFLKSGLAQNLLAHIWALCDTDQSGKLTSEQFALAMWLIDRKKKGIDPPQVLTPEMIPPSMRPNAAQPQPPKPIFTNPELEMISKEIEELTKERHAIEAEVAQKEADIRIKTGEMRSLQSELDTLTATLKQLETQREQAQKRLDDLQVQVNKLKEQCQKQEETIKEQETELDSRKQELQKLKDEEHALEQEYENSLKEKEKISVQLQDTQLQISQVRAMVTQLEEIQRQMKDALALCKVAIEENNPVIVSDYSLGIEPEFRDFKMVLVSPEAKPKDAFGDDSSFNDPFKPETTQSQTAVSSGFDDSFDHKATAFNDDDSFGNKWSDPFSSQNDPFAVTTSNAPSTNTAKDAFDSDPFAALHAPPKGSSPSPHAPESPSPALPPKQAKKPPPRPAPPRPALPKAAAVPASDGFANFDDFDLKASTVSLSSSSNTLNEAQKSKMEDFNEDPFKNYRYEDPFLIEDPFKDENGNENLKVVNNNDKFEAFFEKDADFFSSKDAVNNNNKLKTSEKFDPFGLSENDLKNSTKTTNQSFGFEADFANFDAFNNNSTMSVSTTNGNGFGDAWGGESKSSIKSGKIKKYNKDIEPSKVTKFSQDYSDNYEKDLEQVLKRSMIDQ